MPCGWEGNRLALAMRHRLQWFIHLRAHGLRNGDEHVAYTLLTGYGTPLPFTFMRVKRNRGRAKSRIVAETSDRITTQYFRMIGIYTVSQKRH